MHAFPPAGFVVAWLGYRLYKDFFMLLLSSLLIFLQAIYLIKIEIPDRNTWWGGLVQG